ncbi:hypothetical protein TKK_0004887 [Trichogramma kaykai]
MQPAAPPEDPFCIEEWIERGQRTLPWNWSRVSQLSDFDLEWVWAWTSIPTPSDPGLEPHHKSECPRQVGEFMQPVGHLLSLSGYIQAQALLLVLWWTAGWPSVWKLNQPLRALEPGLV